jgi:hypothetical protein
MKCELLTATTIRLNAVANTFEVGLGAQVLPDAVEVWRRIGDCASIRCISYAVRAIVDTRTCREGFCMVAAITLLWSGQCPRNCKHEKDYQKGGSEEHGGGWLSCQRMV